MSGSSCSHKPLSCSSPPWPGQGRWPLIVGERHQKAAANQRAALFLSTNRRRAGRHHPEKLQPTLYNYLLAVIGCQQSFYSTAKLERFFRLMKRIIKTLITHLIFKENNYIRGFSKYNWVCMYTVATCFMSSKSFHRHLCSIDLSHNIYWCNHVPFRAIYYNCTNVVICHPCFREKMPQKKKKTWYPKPTEQIRNPLSHLMSPPPQKAPALSSTSVAIPWALCPKPTVCHSRAPPSPPLRSSTVQ